MNFEHSRVVEIIGPAGSGKTTLSRALQNSSPRIYLDNFPDVRQAAAAPFFVWNGLRVAPSLLGLLLYNGGRLTRREFAWLSILHGWPDLLQRAAGGGGIRILDQGPIYLLAEAIEFGPEWLRGRMARALRQNLYSRWANTLDMVLWLDAPDADLLKRIRGREKEHAVKAEADSAAIAFLACYRMVFERIISELAARNRSLKILCFDSGQRTLDEIVSQCLFEFDRT